MGMVGRIPIIKSILNFFTYFLTYYNVQVIIEKLIVTQFLKKYPAFFMEPEGLLPCTQKPAIRSYSEPVESSSSNRSI